MPEPSETDAVREATGFTDTSDDVRREACRLIVAFKAKHPKASMSKLSVQAGCPQWAMSHIRTNCAKVAVKHAKHIISFLNNLPLDYTPPIGGKKKTYKMPNRKPRTLKPNPVPKPIPKTVRGGVPTSNNEMLLTLLIKLVCEFADVNEKKLMLNYLVSRLED